MTVVGVLASERSAFAFADHVVTLLGRYATEVVAAHRLCPHLHDVDAGLGEVVVVLERGFRAELAASAIRATRGRVVHAVFPLATRATSFGFERFCNQVAVRVRDDPRSLVHAAFHPTSRAVPNRRFA